MTYAWHPRQDTHPSCALFIMLKSINFSNVFKVSLHLLKEFAEVPVRSIRYLKQKLTIDRPDACLRPNPFLGLRLKFDAGRHGEQLPVDQRMECRCVALDP